MFTLKCVTVRGFRGFRDTEQFEFDQPLTVLFGPNACCKSSTTNAIEWGFFGDACAGKQTGLRERVGWSIANQHLPVPDVRVELQISGPEGKYVVVRSLRRPPKKTAEQEFLELTLPDGSTLTGDAAAEQLAGLLQSSFRDFLTTTYQHQEAIRAVLTQEPKDRNDAIDRLLGLSDQRNLLCALDSADLRSSQKDIGKDFSAFEEQVTVALTTREHDLAALRQEAQDAGLAHNQLTGKAAVAAAGKIAEDLQQFAEEADLEISGMEVPDDWTRLPQFDKEVKTTIAGLRGQVPGIEEQKKLLKRQQQLLAVRTALEAVRQRQTDVAAKCRALDMEHGGRKAIDTKIADATEKLEAEQEQMRRTNGRAAVVNEAIGYFDSIDNQDTCPVCETVAPGLADQVKAVWAAKLKALVDGITVKINALKAVLKELRGIADQYHKFNEELKAVQDQQTALRNETAKLLDTELGDDDDPLSLAGVELNRLDSRLKKLSQAIQDRQQRLDAIEQDLDLLRLARNYLDLERKKQVLETIQESDAFKQLEAIRDEVAQLVEDAEAIKAAVAGVARDEAETRLARAGKIIDEYFGKLSRNPAVKQLKLNVTADKRTRRNSYEITDQDGKDLTPILSQGDLNALALAIFLGLAAAADDGASFGFLMLDDPSQSFGTEHKKQLAQVLDQVARRKRLIISTMDAEFHKYLEESLTKAKRQYCFGKWTPEEGPTITVQDADGESRPSRSKHPSKARLQHTPR